MFARKAGNCHAIARVRNPSYSHELDFIKKQIGISAIIRSEEHTSDSSHNVISRMPSSA